MSKLERTVAAVARGAYCGFVVSGIATRAQANTASRLTGSVASETLPVEISSGTDRMIEQRYWQTAWKVQSA